MEERGRTGLRTELFFESPPVMSVELMFQSKVPESIYYTCPREPERTFAPTESPPCHDTVFSKRYLVYDAGDRYFDGTTNTRVVYPYEQDTDARNSCPFNTLRFQSFFECGNLQRAVMVGQNEYDLILRSDSTVNLGNQWFYFEVTVPARLSGASVTFNVLNCVKPTSLFGKGMRPLMYCKECIKSGKGSWTRCGGDIRYSRNQYMQPNRPWKSLSDNYHTLSFTVAFHEHDRETTYRLSYCYPYSYTDLLTTLRLYKSNAMKGSLLRISSLCKTVGDRFCPLLTITDFGDKSDIATRPMVVLVARVHPGETPGSWVMQGILEQLLSLTPLGAQIRKKFVFKVVPMLNPDGTALGMSRCNLSSVDLNRTWKNPSKAKNPTIYWTKEMIREISRSKRLFFFCDIHGHSRDKDMFLFGCEESTRVKVLLQELVGTPMKKYLSLQSCNYTVQKSREGTGRVVIYREFRVPYSFTLEASCCGGTFDSMKDVHYSLENYKESGHSFVVALLRTALRLTGDDFLAFSKAPPTVAEPSSHARAESYTKRYFRTIKPSSKPGGSSSPSSKESETAPPPATPPAATEPTERDFPHPAVPADRKAGRMPPPRGVQRTLSFTRRNKPRGSVPAAPTRARSGTERRVSMGKARAQPSRTPVKKRTPPPPSSP